MAPPVQPAELWRETGRWESLRSDLRLRNALDRIVTVTVVLADEDDFAGMNEEWLRWFPSNPPARQGAKLPAKIPGLKVSIAAIAEA